MTQPVVYRASADRTGKRSAPARVPPRALRRPFSRRGALWRRLGDPRAARHDARLPRRRVRRRTDRHLWRCTGSASDPSRRRLSLGDDQRGRERRHVLVVRRIHVSYQLRLHPKLHAAAERSHTVHADNCPATRTIRGCVDITTRRRRAGVTEPPVSSGRRGRAAFLTWTST